MWPKRRGRKVFPAKVKPRRCACSEGVERGMPGRLCKATMPRLGGGRGGGWLLMHRYRGATAGF